MQPAEVEVSGNNMPSCEEHFEDCYKELGDGWMCVHHWLDEFAKIYFPKKIHRVHRHHLEGVEKVREMWGNQATKAAEIHILKDEGVILTESQIRSKYKAIESREAC